jgi:hypothetical protein
MLAGGGSFQRLGASFTRTPFLSTAVLRSGLGGGAGVGAVAVRVAVGVVAATGATVSVRGDDPLPHPPADSTASVQHTARIDRHPPFT